MRSDNVVLPESICAEIPILRTSDRGDSLTVLPRKDIVAFVCDMVFNILSPVQCGRHSGGRQPVSNAEPLAFRSKSKRITKESVMGLGRISATLAESCYSSCG